MSVYYVYQGDTYAQEREGGYVWSPKLTRNGVRNAGYTMMTNIMKGDFILHNCNGKIKSINIAKTDCYYGDKPAELAGASIDWDRKGYRIDTAYFDLDKPLAVTDYKSWLADLYNEESAFTRNGTGKQQYMCAIDDEHAVSLLENAIALQTTKSTIKALSGALSDIVGEKDSEYGQVEKEEIDRLVGDSSGAKPEWKGEKKEQAMTTSPATGRAIPKREPQNAADALSHADYLCEFDSEDKTFLGKKNGKPYTEPHHLIPISKYRVFDYSVDCMENIVSLCSHCHNLLHYGRLEYKVPVLRKLYNERKDALVTAGLILTFEQLVGYYK